MDGVWLTLRVLALLALTGFLAVGLMFTLTPQTFTGKTVDPRRSQARLWRRRQPYGIVLA